MLPLKLRALIAFAALAAGATAVLVARTRPVEPPPSCVTSRDRVIVRGNSLGTLAPPGTELELWRGYYICEPARRGEWVALELQGRDVPLAKVVHAVPGDAFGVEAAPGGFFLNVGGVRAVNSRGVPFQVDARGWRLLRHLADITGGVVPADSLLVLGDLPQATVDSRAFGLISRTDVIGRLILPR